VAYFIYLFIFVIFEHSSSNSNFFSSRNSSSRRG